jgi:NAD-dependent deacetylase
MNTTLEEKIHTLSDIIQKSNNIVFFGGAGVSTASDIPDFRSSNGLFSKKLNRNLSPEQLVSHTFFEQHPEDFFEFYKKHLVYPDARPNHCHLALARLEQMGKLQAVITQNIDGLHQAAGSKKVYELHGSVLRNYCTGCHTFYDAEFRLNAQGIPLCTKCGAVIKPDVVLYEESLDDSLITKSIQAISTADTLIIGGTSLIVYPAAGLINYFQGNHLILINKSTTSADNRADLVIHDDIDKVMQKAVDALKK